MGISIDLLVGVAAEVEDLDRRGDVSGWRTHELQRSHHVLAVAAGVGAAPHAARNAAALPAPAALRKSRREGRFRVLSMTRAPFQR